MDLEKLKKEFDLYTSNYDMSVKQINLKYNHSYKVADLILEIGSRLNLSNEDLDLCYVIGLLHDIGRFEQFKKYNTLNDSASTDHADEACIYLFDEGHIRDFVSDDKYDDIIYHAIKNHNKKEIDENIKNDKTLLFCKLIRDADKIDIYRVCAVYYENKFDCNEVTMEVLENFKNNKLIDLNLRNSKSDTIISVLAFVFDINFNESFDILAETDNFMLYTSSIEIDSGSEKLWKKIKDIAIEKINKGVC